jgi:hypothetical protein
MSGQDNLCILYGLVSGCRSEWTARLRALIAERTAVDAARYLLSPSTSAGFSWGFELLAAANLLSHSIEQAALDFADSGLFSEEQLSKARAQLAIAALIWRKR